jgi:hypothetical protein
MDIVKEQIKQYIKDKAEVFINYNNENGEWIYAVQVINTDFWLNAFKTREKAIEYINKNGLVLKQ